MVWRWALGGARGISHIGVLKVLDKAGIKIDYIVGTSMGAVIASMYALGMNAREIEAEALKSSSRLFIFKFIDISLRGEGMIGGKKIARHLKNIYKGSVFTQTGIPLRVVCTDLESGQEVVLKQGDIASAVQASLSLPGVFPPVRIGKKLLVDGGVVNPTPINVAREMGASTIIAVDLVMQKNRKLSKPTIAGTPMRTFEIVRSEAVKNRIKDKKTKLMIIKPKMNAVMDSFKFSQVKELIVSGELAAKSIISDLKKLQ